jgi:hypothetical protein
MLTISPGAIGDVNAHPCQVICEAMRAASGAWKFLSSRNSAGSDQGKERDGSRAGCSNGAAHSRRFRLRARARADPGLTIVVR